MKPSQRRSGGADAAYVTDANGVVWRVLDCRFGPPHHPPYQWSTREPPDPAASFRAFVADRPGADGRREARSYTWREGESRTDLADETLRRQLREAAWWDRRPVAELIPGYVPDGSHGAAG